MMNDFTPKNIDISNQEASSIVTKNVILRYAPEVVEEPIVYNLVKNFDLIPNIIKASVNPEKRGYLLLSLTGREEDYAAALTYLQQPGMEVQSLVDKVSWDQEVCTQCGACTAVCPSGALSIQRPQMTVGFDGEKCVVCHMCIEACPVKAVRLDF